jgi:hypothetical protein
MHDIREIAGEVPKTRIYRSMGVSLKHRVPISRISRQHKDGMTTGVQNIEQEQRREEE